MDREKVIRALENCTDKIKCRDCPWEPCEDFDYTHSEYPDGLIKDALELLKAQEPVKPTRIDRYTRTEPITFEYKCTICWTGLMRHWVCCPNCGRAVKWDG